MSIREDRGQVHSPLTGACPGLLFCRYAKIDRPNKIVSFREAADASGQLNSWAGNISGLLSLVEQSCHLIAREEMIAKAKKGKR
jgi:hypothetical protein